MEIENKNIPLKDSGNRTSFGTEALRDIQPENGRFDLLPHGVIAGYLGTEEGLNTPYERGLIAPLIFDSIESFRNVPTVKTAMLYRIAELFTYEALHEKLSPSIEDISQAKWFYVWELAKHYSNGALKYGERNWEKGLPIHSFIDSALRHYTKFQLGLTDEPHDVAFLWNILGAIYTLGEYPELDDFSK